MSIQINALSLAVLMLCLVWPHPGLCQTDQPKDSYVGTFSEGLSIQSGKGQDTILQVTPPPEKEDNASSEVWEDGAPDPEIIIPIQPRGAE